MDFVCIAEVAGSDDVMELPLEKNGTILISTVQAQFPNAIGLKYKSSSGGWRGIRAADGALDPPDGGWGDATYVITESSALKRKSDVGETNGNARKSRKEDNLLEDIIVLGLPYSTTEDEFQNYFTENCGELAFHELKFDRATKKSRGFGFIRFKYEDAAKEALNSEHRIDGRRLEIRLSKKKEDNPTKLFIGRLPEGTTQEDLNDYFSEFGDLVDVFVPSPHRGFGFITFSAQEDAMKVLRLNHNLKGTRLNVTAAEPKEPKVPPGGQMSIGSNNWNQGNSSNNYWKTDSPTKLFIGRLGSGTSQYDVKEYFSSYGMVIDTFVPNPFRGFGFVTFASQEDASRVLQMNHTLKGSHLHITPAQPRESEQGPRSQENNGNANYSWNPSNPMPTNRYSETPLPNNQFQEPPNQPLGQKDVASELKDMLMTLINSRK